MVILHQNIARVNRINSLCCKIVGLELRYSEIQIFKILSVIQFTDFCSGPVSLGLVYPPSFLPASGGFIRQLCGGLEDCFR